MNTLHRGEKPHRALRVLLIEKLLHHPTHRQGILQSENYPLQRGPAEPIPWVIRSSSLLLQSQIEVPKVWIKPYGRVHHAGIQALGCPKASDPSASACSLSASSFQQQLSASRFQSHQRGTVMAAACQNATTRRSFPSPTWSSRRTSTRRIAHLIPRALT